VGNKAALILQRFDRKKSGAPIPFVSAISMLGASDNEPHSYLDIAEALRQTGAAPNKDLQQLWRRIVFNVLISNTTTTCAIMASSMKGLRDGDCRLLAT
jgi:serine/threonine-protein kinase HipA